MAINISDFDKIWASTSPLTPYSFSESNYKEGWNFVGATPPARQMWDSYMKWSDEKQQYIVNNFLPLSGGTMTGNIVRSGGSAFASRNVDNSLLYLGGGTTEQNGAYLALWGKDGSENGSFVLRANDGVDSCFLKGYSNGILTWNEQSVVVPNIKLSSITKGTFPGSTTYGRWLSQCDKNGTAQKDRLFAEGLTINTASIVYSWILYDYTLDATSGKSVNLINTSFYPTPDNTLNLGSSSARWKQLYAVTSTINTSDERLKDNIEPIPDEVLDAWAEVNWYQFQFKDAIAEKGKSARIHTGTIAQRIKETFEKHNLDAFRYGLLCHDSWDATEEEKDENGNIVQESREVGDLYSLRYEEALCMESAYQRRRADRLEERIEKLEKLIEAK